MTSMKAIPKLILLVGLAFTFSTCDPWGTRSNPVDAGATNYVGYPTAATTDEITTVSPSAGGSLTGSIVVVTKVLGAEAYGIRVAATSAELDTTPLISMDDCPDNRIDLGSAVSQLASITYYWKARALGADGTWGAWSLISTFKPALPSSGGTATVTAQ
jgi:hypothetical protein